MLNDGNYTQGGPLNASNRRPKGRFARHMVKMGHKHGGPRGFGPGRGPGPGPGPGPGFGFGKPGHRRRALSRGNLRYLILELIGEQPRHGYDLIQNIETRSSGAYKPSPGVIYPALDMLVDMGWAEAKDEGGKRVFHLTKSGGKVLKDNIETLANIHARLDELKQVEPEGEAGDLKTAMFRLMHTLKSADRADDMTDAKRAALVKILNEAQTKISKLT